MGWCTILAGVLHLKREVKIAHRCGGWEECGDTFGSRSVSQLLTAGRDSGGIYASHLLAASGGGICRLQDVGKGIQECQSAVNRWTRGEGGGVFKLSLGARLKDKNEEKEYFSNGYRLKRASRPRRAVYFWCLEAPTFIHQSEVFCFFPDNSTVHQIFRDGE